MRDDHRSLVRQAGARLIASVGVVCWLATGCGGSSPGGSLVPPTESPSPTVTADASRADDVDSRREPEVAGDNAEGDVDLSWSQQWAPTDPNAVDDVAAWEVEILDTRPHDVSAYTQGFEVHDNTLYESAGLTGESTIRTVDVDTGDVLMSVDVDQAVFAEGITIVGDRMVQLTWRSQVAYVRDVETLELVGEHAYDGEGWGICNDGARLVMSNGTPELAFRDPDTFEIIDTVEVTLRGAAVEDLNELECVDGFVLANVYTTTTIVVIEPTSGRVVATIDGSALVLDALGRFDLGRVPNGIARLDESTFLLTGKLWPTMYRVRFVAAPVG